MKLTSEQIDAVVQSSPTQPKVASGTPSVLDRLKQSEAEATKPKEGFFAGLAKAQSTENVGGGILKGIAKGIGSTAYQTGGLIEKGISKLTGQPTLSESISGQPVTEEKPDWLTPQTTAQKIGYTGEQIGEFFLPGGTATKIGKAAELAVKAPKLAKAAGFGARSVAEAGLVGGQTLAQTGDVGDAVTGAIFGGAMPTAGKVLSGAGKILSKTGQAYLGKVTGAGEASIKETTQNPNVIRFAREVGAKGAEELQEKALLSAKEAKNILQKKAGEEYTSSLDKIKLDKTNLDEAAFKLREKADDLISGDKFDISRMSEESVIGKKLNTWDFSKSTITEKSNVVEKALNDVYSWYDWSPKGMDVLKKRLFDFADDASGSKAEILIKDLAHDLDKSLKKMIPEYEKMTSKWKAWKDLGKELDRTLSLSDKASKDTAIRKLMSIMRDNNEMRKGLVDLLTKAGGKDITGMLAGSQMAPIMPKGIAGGTVSVPTLGGAMFSVANPATWPLFVAYLGSSSPRLVGEFLNIVGKAKRMSNGMIDLTPAIKSQIQKLTDETEKE